MRGLSQIDVSLQTSADELKRWQMTFRRYQRFLYPREMERAIGRQKRLTNVSDTERLAKTRIRRFMQGVGL